MFWVVSLLDTSRRAVYFMAEQENTRRKITEHVDFVKVVIPVVISWLFFKAIIADSS